VSKRVKLFRYFRGRENNRKIKKWPFRGPVLAGFKFKDPKWLPNRPLNISDDHFWPKFGR
jgi:hypothetical protein